MRNPQMRPFKRIAPILIFLVTIMSLLVANVRERNRSEIDIPRFRPRQPQTAGFGWPLVAFRQSLPLGTAELVDEDFPGGDEAVIPPRQSPGRTWAFIKRPVSEVHIPNLLVNLAVLLAVLVGTTASALAWETAGGRWSLGGMFIWMTCAAVIFAQLSLDHVRVGWWNPWEPYGVSWIEIVNSVVLAAGCTCALTSVWRAARRFFAGIEVRGNAVW